MAGGSRMPFKLIDMDVEEVSFVDSPANPDARVILFKRAEQDEEQDVTEDEIDKRAWNTAYINTLPDSSFAFIEDGGSKDSEGKTTPRSLRHLPYKDASGKVDLPHLRNALARLPQSSLSAEAKGKAQRKLEAAARSAGVGDYGKSAWNSLLSVLGKKLGWTSQ